MMLNKWRKKMEKNTEKRMFSMVFNKSQMTSITVYTTIYQAIRNQTKGELLMKQSEMHDHMSQL